MGWCSGSWLESRHLESAGVPGFQTQNGKSGRVTEEVLHDSDEALLENLHLVEGAYFKRAAALLFHDNPEKFALGAYIKIGFFITNDDLRYQDEIHGSLFDQVEKTLDLLFSKYMKAYISYEGIQRIEKFLFPKLALREALLNAVIHKDYSSGAPIQLSVYEDHIVLWNSGQLPHEWTLERLLGKHPSEPYNPLLANAFFRSGYIEAWGRGIEKINGECLQHGILPPVYDDSLSGLMLTFQAEEKQLAQALDHEKALPEVASAKNRENSSEKTREKTREKILALIQQNPQMTTTELTETLGITMKGIEWQITQLKKRGFLRRIGPKKGGHWEVLKSGGH